MKLLDQYDGSGTPFEGDRTLLLHGLPAGARILHARINLTPIDTSGGSDPFTETITFTGHRGDWGATKAVNADWVEVDFHARRTLAWLKGSNLNNATLQIDLGGAYVEINDKGALAAPGSTLFTISGNEQRLPGLTVVKFKLSNTGANPDIQKIVIRSTPSNVSVRLGNLAPFWTRVGEITTPQASTDFARILQAFITDQEAINGFYRLPFTLHSDTLTRLSVTVEIEYLFETALLPAGLNEVSLPFDYDSFANIDEGVLQVALPPNAQVVPRDTTASVIGAFDDSRIVYGPLGNIDAPGEVLVSPSATQAQPIRLNEGVGATAVDLLLAAVTRTVRLQLDLREDLDGKPAGASLLTENVEFSLDRETAGQATWISVPLPQEFQFQARQNARYWLVMQSLEGKAVWSAKAVDADTPGLQNTQNGGLSWRLSGAEDITGPVAALFRLRYQPDRYQVPIELEIGSGSGAQRVKLDRFQPLGRVEFALDLPEVAEAFNDYLRQANPASCIEAEHIADGGFDQWRRMGDEIGEAIHIALDSEPFLIAATADGLTVYIATRANAELPIHLEKIDALTGTKQPSIDLGIISSPVAMIMHPHGDRLYLMTGMPDDSLHVFDTTNDQLLDPAINIPGSDVTDMAISPDGSRLYITQYHYIGAGYGGNIRVYDTTPLGRLLLEIAIGAGKKPTTIAVSAAGMDKTFLYVLSRETSPNEPDYWQNVLYRYETDHHTISGTPLFLGRDKSEGGSDLAISSCGHLAVVSNSGDQTLSVIDLKQWRPAGPAVDVGATPDAIVLSPDGERIYGFTKGETSSFIGVGDTHQRRQIIEPKEVSGLARDIAVAPNGGRLYLPLSNGTNNTLAILPTASQDSLEWIVTAGRTSRTCFPVPFGNVVVLGINEPGATPIATTLAQVTPITADCASPFRFSFWGIATELDAVAEIVWISATCTPLKSDQIPIEVREKANTGSNTTSPMPSAVDMVLHSQRLTPPEGATQAEVRFKTTGGIAIIDNVSLRVTAEATTNSTLRLDTGGQPFHWTQQPATGTGLTLMAQGDGVQLSNTGSESISLIQTTRITPEQAFELQFHGRTVDIFSEDSLPTIELHWLDSKKAIPDADISLPIPARDFERHIATGEAPSQANQAEVRITLPPQTTLTTRYIALRQQAPTTVPVGFLSHAPGELNVSQGRIVYDLGESLPLQVPSTGLCRPIQTKPTQARYTCFCGICEASHEMTCATPALTPAGRPATTGTCSACGSSVINLGGRLDDRAPNIAFFERKLVPLKRVPEKTRMSAVSHQPQKYKASRITRIKGIGDARAQKLISAGITSIRKLAAIKPEKIQRILKTISLTQANQLVEEAKLLYSSDD